MTTVSIGLTATKDANGAQQITITDSRTLDSLNPKELAARALAACSGLTVLSVAPSRKWAIEGLTITVTVDEEADPDEASKKRFVIKKELSVKGDLSQQDLAAIKRVAGKCPVYRMFAETNKRMETVVTHVVEPVA